MPEVSKLISSLGNLVKCHICLSIVSQGSTNTGNSIINTHPKSRKLGFNSKLVETFSWLKALAYYCCLCFYSQHTIYWNLNNCQFHTSYHFITRFHTHCFYTGFYVWPVLSLIIDGETIKLNIKSWLQCFKFKLLHFLCFVTLTKEVKFFESHGL